MINLNNAGADTLANKHRKASQSIQEAWQQKDTSLLASYLADEIEWYEGVAEKPLANPKDVIARWGAEVPTQTNVKVDVKLLDFVGKRGYHRCKASWQDQRGSHSVDAIFIIRINKDGKITYFMPWYENN